MSFGQCIAMARPVGRLGERTDSSRRSGTEAGAARSLRRYSLGIVTFREREGILGVDIGDEAGPRRTLASRIIRMTGWNGRPAILEKSGQWQWLRRI